MDLLSQVFRSHSLGAALLARHDHGGAWGIQISGATEIGLHFVEQGSCHLRLLEREPVLLRQGDVALLPRGTPHVISDAPRRRAVPLEAYLRARPVTEGPFNARLVCAAQRLDAHGTGLHPLMRELPELVHLPSSTLQSCPSLGPCLGLLLRELQGEGPGREGLVAMLLETFLLYVIRHWIEHDAPEVGFVGAIRDPRLRRSLSAMHDDPSRPWTIEDLAREAGLSRAAFAKLFRARLSETPLTYLARLRMAKATQKLRQTEASLGEIAAEVGYSSEFAFSRAYKRIVGRPPSQIRTVVS